MKKSLLLVLLVTAFCTASAQDYIFKNFNDHFSISKGTQGINIYGNDIKDNLGNYFLKSNTPYDASLRHYVDSLNAAIFSQPHTAAGAWTFSNTTIFNGNVMFSLQATNHGGQPRNLGYDLILDASGGAFASSPYRDWHSGVAVGNNIGDYKELYLIGDTYPYYAPASKLKIYLDINDSSTDIYEVPIGFHSVSAGWYRLKPTVTSIEEVNRSFTIDVHVYNSCCNAGIDKVRVRRLLANGGGTGGIYIETDFQKNLSNLTATGNETNVVPILPYAQLTIYKNDILRPDGTKALFTGSVPDSAAFANSNARIDSALFIPKNGYDIANKATFRSNLGVYSKAYVDSLNNAIYNNNQEINGHWGFQNDVSIGNGHVISLNNSGTTSTWFIGNDTGYGGLTFSKAAQPAWIFKDGGIIAEAEGGVVIDSLAHTSQLRSLNDSLSKVNKNYKNKADSIANSGYVTHGYFNSHGLTFNNGLTNTSGTVQLGGQLTNYTTIDASSYAYNVHSLVNDGTWFRSRDATVSNGGINLLSYYSFLATDEDWPNEIHVNDQSIVLYSGHNGPGAPPNSGSSAITIEGDNGITFESGKITLLFDGVAPGATYAADYSANYVARSLVDKAYVDNKVSDGPVGIAGGDLTGTYPTPTINTINSITKNYYDPTSSIQTQLNSKVLKDSTLNINKNLYDIPNRATARTNLSVYSKAESDANYINLNGLSGGQSITGGTGTTDALSLIGTRGNGSLTNIGLNFNVGNNGGTTALSVLNNGKIGIGTTSPSQMLTINSTGILGWDNGSGTADVLLQRDGAANRLGMGNGSNAQTFEIGLNGANGITGTNALVFNTNVRTARITFDNATGRLNLVPATAQIGIGFGTLNSEISKLTGSTNATLAFGVSGTMDAGITRVSAGVIGIGNGTEGNTSGTLQASAAQFNGLTASQAVFTDASKNLISNAISGTGSVIMSLNNTQTAPTLLTVKPASTFQTPTGASTDSVVTKNATTLKLGAVPVSQFVLSSTVLTATATLAFPATSTGNSSDLTITVTGAAVGDVVSLGIPSGAMPSGTSGAFYQQPWVSAANTVTVRFTNLGAGSVTPASGTFKVKVFK